RTLFFSTALPPPAAAAARASLEILQAQPERVDKLRRNARALRDALAAEGVEYGDTETQIVPLIVGDASDAMDACERALARGIFAQAIRPPTVPDGSSRLRLAVMASHTRSELRSAAGVLVNALRTTGARTAAASHEPESAPASPRRAKVYD